jgi:hypothetical protein
MMKMSKDKVDLTLRLPNEELAMLKAISKSAGVKVETVIKVMIATYIYQNKLMEQDLDYL